MRYLLFCGASYYPKGGVRDLYGVANSVEECIQIASKITAETRAVVFEDDDEDGLGYHPTDCSGGWYQVFDTEACKIVSAGEIYYQGDGKWTVITA